MGEQIVSLYLRESGQKPVGGFSFRGDMSKKVYFQLVVSQIYFRVISTPQIWSSAMEGYTDLIGNPTKILEKDKALRGFLSYQRMYPWGKS